MDIGWVMLLVIIASLGFAAITISLCKFVVRVKEAFYHETLYKKKLDALSSYRKEGEYNEYYKRIKTENELKSVLEKLDEISAKLDKAETIIRNQERMIDAFKKAYDNGIRKSKSKTETKAE